MQFKLDWLGFEGDEGIRLNVKAPANAQLSLTPVREELGESAFGGQSKTVHFLLRVEGGDGELVTHQVDAPAKWSDAYEIGVRVRDPSGRVVLEVDSVNT